MFGNNPAIAGSIRRNPTFRWLCAGSGLNSAGMQGEQVVLGLLVYQLTGSSAWVGISLALSFLPMLLIGVPAGALADRFDRRKVLIKTEFVLSLALALFAIFLASNRIGLSAALLMSVVSGSLRALHHPARLSFTGDISGNSGMVVALSFLGIVSRFGQLVGALFAGLIMEVFGPGMAYFALAFGHLIAAVCFIKTSIKSVSNPATDLLAETTTASKSLRYSIKEYVSLLFGSSTLMLLLIFASVIEIFGFSFATALPEIAVLRLSLDAGGLGFMHAARAAGGLFGAWLLSVLIIGQLGRLYLGVMAGFGLALCFLAFAPAFVSVLLCVALIAVFASSADILVQGMMQLCVPDALRGRAMGAWVVALGMGPIGHLELGLLISLFGVTIALLTNGIVLLFIGLIAWFFSKSVLAIKNHAHPDD